MTIYARIVRASQLSLADEPPASDGAAKAKSGASAGAASLSMEAQDSSLADAEKEYATGRVDAPLWVRALKQAGGDKAQATRIYLDRRVAALRAAKRNDVPLPESVESAPTAPVESAPTPAPVVKPRRNAPEVGSFAPEARDEPASKSKGRNRPVTEGPSQRRMILVGGALGSVVAVAVVGWIALRPGSAPAQQASVANPVLAVSVSQHSTPSNRTATTATNAPVPAGKEVSTEDFVARTQALEKVGNWNLFVIYAAEWTRKQPANAVAWKELSRGYVKLSQLGDALDAAKKAAQLAPEDFLAWQNLGQLHVSLQRPEDALAAFHQAAALNDRDIVSLVHEGMLSTQLGRLPEARVAFDKALALSPEDKQVLCGAAAIAWREGRLKDADVMSRQAKALGGRCGESSSNESVHVAGVS